MAEATAAAAGAQVPAPPPRLPKTFNTGKRRPRVDEPLHQAAAAAAAITPFSPGNLAAVRTTSAAAPCTRPQTPRRQQHQSIQPQMSIQSAAGLRTFRQSSGALAAAAPAGTTLSASEFDGEVCSPLCRQRGLTGQTGSSTLICVRVHKCSAPLEADLTVVSPVVRLHLVSAATGEYLRIPGLVGSAAAFGSSLKRQQQGDELEQQHQSGGVPAASSTTLLLEGEEQAQLLEHPGRPELTTVGNNTAAPAAALLSYIPPVQTLPFDLVAAAPGAAAGSANLNRTTALSSSSRASPVTAAAATRSSSCAREPSPSAAVPAWEEDLTLDLPPEILAAEDALMLAEVMQPPLSFRDYKHLANSAATAVGGYGGQRVAWGFARLPGLGVAALGEQPLRVQLQLYRYQPLSVSLASPAPFLDTAAKSAYLSWRSTLGTAVTANPSSGATAAAAGGASPFAAALLASRAEACKYPSALEVSLSAAPRPDAAVVVTDPVNGVRPVLPAGYGSGFEIGA